MEFWDVPAFKPFRHELIVLLTTPARRGPQRLTDHLILSNYVARHYGPREIPQAQQFISERL